MFSPALGAICDSAVKFWGVTGGGPAPRVSEDVASVFCTEARSFWRSTLLSCNSNDIPSSSAASELNEGWTSLSSSSVELVINLTIVWSVPSA